MYHSSTSLSTRKVSCVLVRGLRPRRTIDLANISGVISGTSDRSISPSFILSRRAKSVRDLVEVGFFFIFGCLSGGDDTDNGFRFGMDDQDDMALEQPKRLIACFAIFKAITNHGDCIEFEYCWDIGKINALFTMDGDLLQRFCLPLLYLRLCFSLSNFLVCLANSISYCSL